MKNTNKKGFTLVELVIVIAVIAILAGVLIATFASVIKRANDSAEVQNIKNAEIAQKADDIIKKIEDSNWFGWEDFEASIVAKIAEVVKTGNAGANTPLTSDQVRAIVEDALTTVLANEDNTGLTADQVKTVVENALGTLKYEGVTEAQVRAIVKASSNEVVASQLTAAQVRSIVTAANANNLTAADILVALGSANIATADNITTAVGNVTTAIGNATAGLATSAQVEELKGLIEDISTTVLTNDLEDVVIAKSLNIKLAKSNKVIATPSDVVDAVEQSNPISGVSSNNLVLLDLENKTFVVVKNDNSNEVVYAVDIATGSTLSDTYKYWTFKSVTSSSVEYSDYSVYLLDSPSLTTATLNGVGLDVGNNTDVSTINYTGVTEARTVLIRTNGGTLTINAANDTVNHYGDGIVLDIAAIAGSSYHEYGYFPKASIAQGRIVVEDEGNIPSVEITAVPTSTNPVKIETNKDIVVSASQAVVEELGANTLENVEIKVTNSQAEVVVDEKIDSDNVDAAGKTADDLVSITKVANYSQLSDALAANKTFIMFTDNISYATNGSGLLNVDYSTTIDGDGYTLSGYGARGSQKTTICINNNGGTQMVDVKIQNLTINNSGAGGRPIETRGKVNSLTLENVVVNATGTGGTNNQAITIGGAQAISAKLTINKSTINASQSGYPIISFNPFDAEINDSYFNGYCGIYFKNDTYGAQNCNIVATNTTFNSPNSYSYEGSNSFGVFAIQGGVKNNKITLNSCKVNVEQTGTAYQSLVSFGNGINHSGTIVTINGSDSYINGLLSMNGQLAPDSKIILNGGTYTIDPLSADAEIGTQIVELGNGKTLSSTSDFTWIVK